MEGRMKARIEGHLKSDDFFYVEKFPSSILKIREVIKDPVSEGDLESSYTVVAELTIKEITNTIEFVADININRNQFSATAKIQIDRTLWDIKYHSGNYVKDLGDKLILDEIEFDISLVSVK
jgi:polyisoprenoid-binding protein YceI